jgi:hypothetical protein
VAAGVMGGREGGCTAGLWCSGSRLRVCEGPGVNGGGGFHSPKI